MLARRPGQDIDRPRIFEPPPRGRMDAAQAGWAGAGPVPGGSWPDGDGDLDRSWVAQPVSDRGAVGGWVPGDDFGLRTGRATGLRPGHRTSARPAHAGDGARDGAHDRARDDDDRDQDDPKDDHRDDRDDLDPEDDDRDEDGPDYGDRVDGTHHDRDGDPRPRQLPDPPEGAQSRRSVRLPHRAVGRVAQRWVPEPLRDSRVDPGKRGALLLTLIAAVAALAAAIGVWRDRPEPRPVQSVSLAQVSDAAGPGGGASSTRAIGTLVALSGSPVLTAVLTAAPTSGARVGTAVDAGTGVSGRAAAAETATVVVVSVTGAVHRPGLVRLPTGSRVADAIAKAGGATAAADLTGLNLAAKLADGDSIVVGGGAQSPAGAASTLSGSSTGSGGGGSGGASSLAGGEQGSGGSGPTAAGGTPGGKLDLNTADVAALDALPGVGPVTAANIVAWRDKNGRYTSVEQLQEIQGIGPAKFAALAELVRV